MAANDAFAVHMPRDRELPDPASLPPPTAGEESPEETPTPAELHPAERWSVFSNVP